MICKYPCYFQKKYDVPLDNANIHWNVLYTYTIHIYYVYFILSKVGTHITKSILLHIMFILTIKIRRIHGLW